MLKKRLNQYISEIEKRITAEEVKKKIITSNILKAKETEESYRKGLKRTQAAAAQINHVSVNINNYSTEY